MVAALYSTLLILVGLERIFELILSRRHAAWAFSRGGREFGQRHFFWMKLLHTLFLPACLFEVVFFSRPFLPVLAAAMVLVVFAAQSLRYWAISSLGQFWNVRVIVVPGASPVCSGPYKWLRHPNYLAVILEGVALPLVHSAWLTAVCFSVLNGILLYVRIRCEESALRTETAYDEVFGGKLRFVPQGGRP